MKFRDEGIIISQKKYGENSLILKVFSREHGLYRGFVKFAGSSKSKVIFQVGNLITFEFRMRIEDNLGSFHAPDLVRSYCSLIMFEKLKLDCVNSLFSIIDETFLEREAHPLLFERLQNFMRRISEENCGVNDVLADYVKLELKILKTLGYGIDLSSCVVTNSRVNLTFVSPKSARAVCFDAGKPYQNKLLKLPGFLIEDEAEFDEEHLRQGLELSGFFLEKFLSDEKFLGKKQQFSYREAVMKNLKIRKE